MNNEQTWAFLHVVLTISIIIKSCHRSADDFLYQLMFSKYSWIQQILWKLLCSFCWIFLNTGNMNCMFHCSNLFMIPSYNYISWRFSEIIYGWKWILRNSISKVKKKKNIIFCWTWLEKLNWSYAFGCASIIIYGSFNYCIMTYLYNVLKKEI